MKIYFAGSIRGDRNDAEIYNKVIQYIKKFGEVLTEHVGDKNITSRGEINITERNIFERDLNWLNSTDVAIAEVSAPSLGVGYEIAIAEVKRKPVLCLCRADISLSAMISGNPYVRLRRYTTFNEIVTHIDSFLGEQQSQKKYKYNN